MISKVCSNPSHSVVLYMDVYTMLVFKTLLCTVFCVTLFLLLLLLLLFLFLLHLSLFSISGLPFLSQILTISHYLLSFCSTTCLLPVSGPSLILPPSTQDGLFEFWKISMEGDDLLLCRDCKILHRQPLIFLKRRERSKSAFSLVFHW